MNDKCITRVEFEGCVFSPYVLNGVSAVVRRKFSDSFYLYGDVTTEKIVSTAAEMYKIDPFDFIEFTYSLRGVN